MKKHTLSLLVAVGLIGSASAQVPTGDLANGLVSFYSFNGNANDSVGGNNGTISTIGITYTDGILGGNSQAIHLSGVNNGGIDITPTPFNVANDFTISVWFKEDPLSVYSVWGKINGVWADNLFSTGQDFSDLEARIQNFSVNNSSDPTMQIGAFPANSDGNAMTFFANKIIDKWNNLVYVKNSTQIEFFLNGDFIVSQLNSQTPIDSGTLRIGGYLGGGNVNYGFQGSIANFGIWNTALSSSQVSQLYTLQSAPEPSTYLLFGVGAVGLLMVLRRKKVA